MGAAPQFVAQSIDGPPSPPGASEGADSAALDAHSKTVIAVAERMGRPSASGVEHSDFDELIWMI
jgi:hypothetical protein